MRKPTASNTTAPFLDVHVGDVVVAESRKLNFGSDSREMVRRAGPVAEVYNTGMSRYFIVDGLPFRAEEIVSKS